MELKGKEIVERALGKILEKSAQGMCEAAAGAELDITAGIYGEGEYEAKGGIEISEDVAKKEFGSEDNPPSPMIEAVIMQNSHAAQKRLEDIFKEKMEEH